MVRDPLGTHFTLRVGRIRTWAPIFHISVVAELFALKFGVLLETHQLCVLYKSWEGDICMCTCAAATPFKHRYSLPLVDSPKGVLLVYCDVIEALLTLLCSYWCCAIESFVELHEVFKESTKCLFVSVLRKARQYWCYQSVKPGLTPAIISRYFHSSSITWSQAQYC